MVLAWLERKPLRRRWWLGILVLVVLAWCAMYGKIWAFEGMDQHRFTARAMLTGTLRLRNALAMAKPDEQIFNGSVYTNWGFGVPLLQLPFHAFARLAGFVNGFFPDRAIYFLYLCVSMPVIRAGFDRWMAQRGEHLFRGGACSEADRHRISWGVTFVILALMFVPLMSTRFLIFEETIAYMMILEFLALAAYFFARERWDTLPLVAMGVAAGMALVVRATGLLYLGVWGVLLLRDRQWRRAVPFTLAAIPFVAFWGYTNWVRTGSPISIGFINSNPAWEYETPILRFGGLCANSPAHFLQTAARLFEAFFVFTERAAPPFMRACHFDFEERDGMRDPFLGPGVLVLVAGTVWGLVRRRERRISAYVVQAAFAMLFVAYVRRGDGFAWRYQGDFWPLVVLNAVIYADDLPAAAPRVTARRMGTILLWLGVAAMARYWVPWEWTYRANVLGGRDVTEMGEDFAQARWSKPEPLPTKLSCADRPLLPFHNGLGWRRDCSVNTFTNLYLGVPQKADGRYTLTLRAQDMTAESVRVYLNGRFYDARRNGASYEAQVVIDYGVLHEPAVMLTVHWVPDLTPPAGRFLSAELS
jgi:hypothetical protein